MQISSDARIEILKDSEERPLLVLESRQMTAIAFGVVLVIGIVACTAYLVGRRLPERAAAASPAPAVHTRRARTVARPAVSAPPPAASVAAATPAPAPTPVQAQAVKPPAPPQPAPVQNPAPAVSSTGLIQPVKGQNFLQVGNLTPDTVQPFVESLNAKGFRAKLAAGADRNSVRILIGPLKNAEIAPVSADLTKAGFANFPKFY
ncbi:hypothetical protein [Paludibaculum fermentans]|uniref:SPOR domain-containing protein n=1 Tax=Paludibaculum fermentans TaxID=1473598 RepID=A0A7S7SMT8_PALFE|nr:hypothetical protein [Paludibaculum fermentans]QOY90774.1 hypothetical protein IRI77_12750 [Paludibaculum fermentans]